MVKISIFVVVVVVVVFVVIRMWKTRNNGEKVFRYLNVVSGMCFIMCYI